jgi:hypothetical protein
MDTKRETSDGLVTVTYTRDPRCRITFTIIGERNAAVSLRSISDVRLFASSPDLILYSSHLILVGDRVTERMPISVNSYLLKNFFFLSCH